MYHPYHTALEEGEIQEATVAQAPLSYWSEYQYDDDDESIKSSRPCTPPGLLMSKGIVLVPATPAPNVRTMSIFGTDPESPTPPSLARPSKESHTVIRHPVTETGSSAAAKLGDGENRMFTHPSNWMIPSDLCEKAKNALARVAGMDKGCEAQHSHEVMRVEAGAPSAQSAHQYRSQLEACQGHSGTCQPPSSPLSPEELERAIGIIEDLIVVDGVPPHVFVQCGISPGTLYHAFNHLGLKLPAAL